MGNDFGAEREVVAKIRSRLDLCCQYFNGLGKGLADTSKQMASGEGGLLPSKSNGSMLPAIPKAGRTPRVASISPSDAEASLGEISCCCCCCCCCRCCAAPLRLLL